MGVYDLVTIRDVLPPLPPVLSIAFDGLPVFQTKDLVEGLLDLEISDGRLRGAPRPITGVALLRSSAVQSSFPGVTAPIRRLCTCSYDASEEMTSHAPLCATRRAANPWRDLGSLQVGVILKDDQVLALEVLEWRDAELEPGIRITRSLLYVKD